MDVTEKSATSNSLAPQLGTTLSSLTRSSRSATLRCAFVGQDFYFGRCSWVCHEPDIHARFVDATFGVNEERAKRELLEFEPDVMIVFRPEVLPDLVRSARAPWVIGVFTEPLVQVGAEGHPDLHRRFQDFAAADLTGLLDRVVVFSPAIIGAVEQYLDVWQVVPLPVADFEFKRPIEIPLHGELRGFFQGRVTRHRATFLDHLKHRRDWLIVDHGSIAGQEAFPIALNLHNERYLNFENRVLRNLAQGHLAMSERLQPTFGMQPGTEYLEFEEPGQMLELLEFIEMDREYAREVQLRGHHYVQRHRASRVWARVLSDLAMEAR